MKKLFALLSSFAMMMVMVGPARAQDVSETESVGFLEAVRRVASLENYDTAEILHGEFDTDFVDVVFELTAKNNLDNKDGYAVSTAMEGYIELRMDSEIYAEDMPGYEPEFEYLRLQGAAEVIGLEMDKAYIKLDRFDFDFEGNDTSMEVELMKVSDLIRTIVGKWYALDQLEDMRGFGPDLDQLAFLADFKMNPEEAIHKMIEEIVEQNEKDSQFFEALYPRFEEDFVDPFSVDYNTYLEDDEVEKTKIDKDALEEKGVLICHYFPVFDEEILMEEAEIGLVPEPELKEELEDELPQELPMKGDEIDMELIEGFDVEEIEDINLDEELMKKPESFENGFQHMYCFPNEKYQGELIQEEQSVLDFIEKRGGEWLHVDGDWYIVEVYPHYPDFEEQQALRETFDYDETAIAAKVAQARRGVNLFFDTDFFRHKTVARGEHAGYQFFSLNHNKLADFIYQVALITGETPPPGGFDQLRREFGKMRLGGLYHLNEEGLLDDLKARFRFTEGDFVDMTIRYQFDLVNAEADNKITAPTDVNSIDELTHLFEEL